MIKANIKHEQTNANIIMEEAIKKVKMTECASSFVDEIFQVCESAIENTTTEYKVQIAFLFNGWNFNDCYTREEKQSIVMDAVEMASKEIVKYGYSCSVIRYTSKNTDKAGCIWIDW